MTLPLFETIPGWYSTDELRALTIGVKAAKDSAGNLVEVGVARGRSANAILQTMEKEGIDATLFLIDDLSLKIECLPEIANHPRTVSSAALSAAEPPFRFIHLDSDHTAATTLYELTTLCRHLSPGGVLAFHDWDRPAYPGVRQAWEAFVSCNPGWTDLGGSGCTKLWRKV